MPRISARLVVLVAVLAVAAAGAALALAARSGGSTTSTMPAPATAVAPASQTRTSAMTVNQIYRQDSRGVVDIKVSTTPTDPLGLSTQQAQTEGAGVVYDTKGDIGHRRARGTACGCDPSSGLCERAVLQAALRTTARAAGGR